MLKNSLARVRRLGFLLGLCTFVAPIACVKKKSAEIKIVGGVLAGNSSSEDQQIASQVLKSTVALVRASGRVFCSGAIIDPKHIVTAAHCAAHADQGSRVTFGAVADRDAPSSRGIASFVRHERFRDEQDFSMDWANFDIAIVTLDANIPQGFMPVDVEQHPIGKSNIPVVAAGFGANQMNWNNGSGSLSGFGELRFISQRATPARGMQLRVDTRGICDGDSGGPLYRNQNGTLTLVGITSFYRSSGSCEVASKTFFTDVVAYRGWIERRL